MPEKTWQHWFLVVRRALRAPLPLSVLVGAVLFAVADHGFAGGLAMAAAVVFDIIYALIRLNDENFVRSALREAHEQQRRDELQKRTFRIEELDVDSRLKMKTIIKLQNEIQEDVENSPIDGVAAGLAVTVEQTQELVDRGLAMAQKRRDLLRYLSKTDESTIVTRIDALKAKLTDEQDLARKSELELSINAKQQELDDYYAINHAAARVLDQLDSIECSFSSLRARLVRIKSTDIAEWTAANTELQTELSGLNTAVDALEQSVNEALTIRGTS